MLNLLNVLKVLPDDALPFHWAGVARPTVVKDPEVQRLRAEVGGLFMPVVRPWGPVAAGDLVGEVVDPIGGRLLEEVRSPFTGRVLALREQPVVLPGTMVARVVAGGENV